MQITENAVVFIHYTLTDKSGEVLDTSLGSEPLSYLHGRGNVIPGLEKELEGKEKGDKFNITVPPEQAYGRRDENLVRQVPKSAFENVKDLQPGTRFQSKTESGTQIFTVTKIEDEKVTIDGNHPLAGEALIFEVEVTAVREASDEEVSHGHIHRPDGHDH